MLYSHEVAFLKMNVDRKCFLFMKDDIFLCIFSFRRPLFFGVKSFRLSKNVFKRFFVIMPLSFKFGNVASSVCEI